MKIDKCRLGCRFVYPSLTRERMKTGDPSGDDHADKAERNQDDRPGDIRSELFNALYRGDRRSAAF